mmetsp:Transcript_112956/g.364676  ORF Transcript_112956/g.364676 Transcript_112956/m.364676 type:complete len:260 (-) Transcript_112956:307-1086(-)
MRKIVKDLMAPPSTHMMRFLEPSRRPMMPMPENRKGQAQTLSSQKGSAVDTMPSASSTNPQPGNADLCVSTAGARRKRMTGGTSASRLMQDAPMVPIRKPPQTPTEMMLLMPLKSPEPIAWPMFTDMLSSRNAKTSPIGVSTASAASIEFRSWTFSFACTSFAMKMATKMEKAMAAMIRKTMKPHRIWSWRVIPVDFSPPASASAWPASALSASCSELSSACCRLALRFARAYLTRSRTVIGPQTTPLVTLSRILLERS